MRLLSKLEKERIFKEIQCGSTKELEKLKVEEENFHWINAYHKKTGDTILHTAARVGYCNVIQYLLNNFTPNAVDCRNNDDKTALHEAAQFAQYECCKILLQNGANVNVLKRADWTPLMLACTKIHTDRCYKTVHLLLTHGSLINYKNKDGWTALHLICREGDYKIFKLLVSHDLDISNKTKNERTALHIACLHGSLEIVQNLLALGIDSNSRDSCGNTPLHEAILSGNIEICKILIDNKADVSCKNNRGFNLLHLAASVGNIDNVKFLINELHFNVNATICEGGFTPLHCAAKKDDKDMYTFLVTCGCDVNIRDNYGRLATDYFK